MIQDKVHTGYCWTATLNEPATSSDFRHTWCREEPTGKSISTACTMKFDWQDDWIPARKNNCEPPRVPLNPHYTLILRSSVSPTEPSKMKGSKRGSVAPTAALGRGQCIVLSSTPAIKDYLLLLDKLQNGLPTTILMALDFFVIGFWIKCEECTL